MKKALLFLLAIATLSSFVSVTPVSAPLKTRLVGTWEVREITTKTWSADGKLEKQEISYPSNSILWTFTGSQVKYPDGTSSPYSVDAKTRHVLLGKPKQMVKIIEVAQNENYLDWQVTKTQEGKKVEQTFGLLKLL